jgi:chromosome segregation ATPase
VKHNIYIITIIHLNFEIMKKKLMMVAVLLGALSLGACVDNNESASVEAVRNAKAEQLMSIANLNNANADAKKAVSAAEVALKEAEAAYKKAQAEAEQAEADQQKLLLEKAQATLEMEIEALKLQAEANLNFAKAQLEQAKADLIAALDRVDQAEKTRIKDLLSKVEDLLDDINADRSSLVIAKNDLAKLNAGLVTAEEVRKQTIAAQEEIKATAQALITEYEKYSQEDKANAETAAKEANSKKIALEKIREEKNTALSIANDDYSTASRNAFYCHFVQALKAMGNDYYIVESVNSEGVSYTNDDATTGQVWKSGYQKYVANVDLIQEEVKSYSRGLAVAEKKLVDAKSELTKAKETDTYKNYAKAVTDAQKKYDEAQTGTEKEQALYELQAAEQTLKSYIQPYESGITSAEEEIENKTESLAKWNEYMDVVTGDDSKAYETLIKSLATAIDNQLDANIAYGKANHNYTVQSQLTSALENVANGLSDYVELIQAQKIVIARADEVIADASTIVTKEQAIANKEKEIAQLENSLSVNEPIYADYLAQIKALVESAE